MNFELEYRTIHIGSDFRLLSYIKEGLQFHQRSFVGSAEYEANDVSVYLLSVF